MGTVPRGGILPYDYERIVGSSAAEFVPRMVSGNGPVVPDWEVDGAHTSLKLGSVDNMVFPNVQMVDGRLVDYTAIPFREDAGYEQSMRSGDYVEYPDEQSARWFGEHYKEMYPQYDFGGPVQPYAGVSPQIDITPITNEGVTIYPMVKSTDIGANYNSGNLSVGAGLSMNTAGGRWQVGPYSGKIVPDVNITPYLTGGLGIGNNLIIGSSWDLNLKHTPSVNLRYTKKFDKGGQTESKDPDVQLYTPYVIADEAPEGYYETVEADDGTIIPLVGIDTVEKKASGPSMYSPGWYAQRPNIYNPYVPLEQQSAQAQADYVRGNTSRTIGKVAPYVGATLGATAAFPYLVAGAMNAFPMMERIGTAAGKWMFSPATSLYGKFVPGTATQLTGAPIGATALDAIWNGYLTADAANHAIQDINEGKENDNAWQIATGALEGAMAGLPLVASGVANVPTEIQQASRSLQNAAKATKRKLHKAKVGLFGDMYHYGWLDRKLGAEGYKPFYYTKKSVNAADAYDNYNEALRKQRAISDNAADFINNGGYVQEVNTETIPTKTEFQKTNGTTQSEFQLDLQEAPEGYNGPNPIVGNVTNKVVTLTEERPFRYPEKNIRNDYIIPKEQHPVTGTKTDYVTTTPHSIDEQAAQYARDYIQAVQEEYDTPVVGSWRLLAMGIPPNSTGKPGDVELLTSRNRYEDLANRLGFKYERTTGQNTGVTGSSRKLYRGPESNNADLNIVSDSGKGLTSHELAAIERQEELAKIYHDNAVASAKSRLEAGESGYTPSVVDPVPWYENKTGEEIIRDAVYNPDGTINNDALDMMILTNMSKASATDNAAAKALPRWYSAIAKPELQGKLSKALDRVYEQIPGVQKFSDRFKAQKYDNPEENREILKLIGGNYDESVIYDEQAMKNIVDRYYLQNSEASRGTASYNGQDYGRGIDLEKAIITTSQHGSGSGGGGGGNATEGSPFGGFTKSYTGYNFFQPDLDPETATFMDFYNLVQREKEIWKTQEFRDVLKDVANKYNVKISDHNMNDTQARFTDDLMNLPEETRNAITKEVVERLGVRFFKGEEYGGYPYIGMMLMPGKYGNHGEVFSVARKTGGGMGPAEFGARDVGTTNALNAHKKSTEYMYDPRPIDEFTKENIEYKIEDAKNMMGLSDDEYSYLEKIVKDLYKKWDGDAEAINMEIEILSKNDEKLNAIVEKSNKYFHETKDKLTNLKWDAEKTRKKYWNKEDEAENKSKDIRRKRDNINTGAKTAAALVGMGGLTNMVIWGLKQSEKESKENREKYQKIREDFKNWVRLNYQMTDGELWQFEKILRVKYSEYMHGKRRGETKGLWDFMEENPDIVEEALRSAKPSTFKYSPE